MTACLFWVPISRMVATRILRREMNTKALPDNYTTPPLPLCFKCNAKFLHQLQGSWVGGQSLAHCLVHFFTQ